MNKLMFDENTTMEEKIAAKNIKSGIYDENQDAIVLTCNDDTEISIDVSAMHAEYDENLALSEDILGREDLQNE